MYTIIAIQTFNTVTSLECVQSGTPVYGLQMKSLKYDTVDGGTPWVAQGVGWNSWNIKGVLAENCEQVLVSNLRNWDGSG